MKTPYEDGFRQPAEWAPHRAVWIAWPSAADLWKEELATAQESFIGMCRAIADPDEHGRARGEQLEVLVPDAASEAAARKGLEGLGARFHRIPFGDIWLRDTAPIFVTRGGEVAPVAFKFNGWGGKYVLEHDEEVAGRVARASNLPGYEFPFVLEGGSIDVDGEGTVLTTRQCLLNPNRGSLSQPEIERYLKASLGAEKVLWLGDGLINDHTDGHVDTIARFIGPGRVVCMKPSGKDDPNADILEQIAADLRTFTDAKGRRLEVVQVPSPGRVLTEDGKVMPASYVNFYIGNRAVVVPTYGSPHDAAGVKAIAALFPNHRTVGVPGKAILGGGGAFHCITQQEPRGES